MEKPSKRQLPAAAKQVRTQHTFCSLCAYQQDVMCGVTLLTRFSSVHLEATCRPDVLISSVDGPFCFRGLAVHVAVVQLHSMFEVSVCGAWVVFPYIVP